MAAGKMAILLILRLRLYSLHCIDYEIGFQARDQWLKKRKERKIVRDG
jgi:hypothetical protein